MTNNTNSFSKFLVCLAIAVSVSACGSKRVAPAEAAVVNTKDITRPPKVVKNQAPESSESNPEETVSYDEWRRRREAQKLETTTPPN